MRHIPILRIAYLFTCFCMYAVKEKSGEYTGKFAPFGYRISPESKSKLIIDEEAAEIVRMIFRLKIDGMSIYQITRHLSEQNIPNPMHYLYIKGIRRDKRYTNQQAWLSGSVKNILENILYLGHLAQGKTRVINSKYVKIEKDNWVTVKHTHEAIISQTDFDIVADRLRQDELRKSTFNRHTNKELPENILKGLIFCAECGRAYQRMAKTKPDNVTYRITYMCRYCNQNNPNYNSKRHMKESELYDAVYKIIHQQVELCIDTCGKINQFITSECSRTKKSELDGRIQNIQRKIERVSG